MGEFADVLEQRNSFLHEQSGYVIENKGAMWKKRSGSGNVYENKGDSGQKAGMLLKRKGEEQDSGFGIHDSGSRIRDSGQAKPRHTWRRTGHFLGLRFWIPDFRLLPPGACRLLPTALLESWVR
jgi:hypothetical protein